MKTDEQQRRVEASYRGARVLVTGGMGFIGSNLALRLVDLGARVTVVDRLMPNHGGNRFNLAPVAERIHSFDADIADPKIAAELVLGQDVIFSLAGQSSHTDSMQDPAEDLHANCSAPLAVLDAARRVSPESRIVYASTRQVYGVPQSLPVNESHPLVPIDVNGCNKLAAENYHLVFHRAYGLPVSILRLTNTFGPRMRILDARQNFLGFWIGEILTGGDITVMGDGLQLRDFNYVDDVVAALLRCARSESAIGTAINLGGGQGPKALGEVAALVCKLAGKGRIRMRPFPPERKIIDIGDYWSDTCKAETILGWRPEVPLEKGLVQTLDYFSRNLEMYRPCL